MPPLFYFVYKKQPSERNWQSQFRRKLFPNISIANSMEIVKKMIDIWGDIFVKKQPVCCVEKLDKERGISAGRIRNIKKQQNPPKSGESIAIHCFRRILHLVGECASRLHQTPVFSKHTLPLLQVARTKSPFLILPEIISSE